MFVKLKTNIWNYFDPFIFTPSCLSDAEKEGEWRQHGTGEEVDLSFGVSCDWSDAAILTSDWSR